MYVNFDLIFKFIRVIQCLPAWEDTKTSLPINEVNIHYTRCFISKNLESEKEKLQYPFDNTGLFNELLLSCSAL